MFTTRGKKQSTASDSTLALLPKGLNRNVADILCCNREDEKSNTRASYEHNEKTVTDWMDSNKENTENRYCKEQHIVEIIDLTKDISDETVAPRSKSKLSLRYKRRSKIYYTSE